MCTFFSIVWQNMTGTLPTELSALSYLQQISVAYNQLEGSIPTEYANLRSLMVAQMMHLL